MEKQNQFQKGNEYRYASGHSGSRRISAKGVFKQVERFLSMSEEELNAYLKNESNAVFLRIIAEKIINKELLEVTKILMEYKNQ